MGPVGWQEMVVIFIVALVLFGPRKLPELGRTLGKAISEFRRASNELKSTFEREMQVLERENESLKEVTRSYVNDTYTSFNESGYDSPYHDSGAYGSYGYESTDSSTSHPSTNGESAVLDAGSETHGSAVTAAQDTVPRTPETETSSTASNPYETPATATHAPEPQPESQHS